MTRRSLQSIRQWMNELKPLVPPPKEEGVYTLPQIAIQEIDRVSEGMSDYIDTLEARVERLRTYAKWMEYVDWPEDMWDENREHKGLLPGDMEEV